MCQSGECESCRLAAKEANAHLAFAKDEKIFSVKAPKFKPSRLRKFNEDVKVGPGADQGDPLDIRFLTIRPQ